MQKLGLAFLVLSAVMAFSAPDADARGGKNRGKDHKTKIENPTDSPLLMGGSSGNVRFP